MGNSNNNLDILLRFLIDEAAKGNTLAAIETIEKQFKGFRDEMDLLKKDAKELKSIANDLGQVFREGFLIGTAITGGIFAAANKYVKDAKEATAVTIAWKASQESLNRSGQRFGAVLAEESLPLLEKAAQLADTASQFIEKHPEIVSAALNTGLVVASLGAVGIAVTKGIRLYADLAYIAAVAQEQAGIAAFSKAVDKFLLGTSEFSGAKSVSGAPSLLSAGPLAAILAGAAGFTAIGRGAANFGARQFGFESPEAFWQKMLDKLGLVKTAADDAAGSLGKVGADLSSAKFSPAFDQVLKAYEQYKADDLALVQKHYDDRQRIIDDALAAEKKADEAYANQVKSINSTATTSRIKAAQDYEQADKKAEENFAIERAKIIRDGGKEIEQIEADGQERLRKLRKEHDERTEDLVAARDALGLVKEQRRYASARAEEIRNTNKEIAQRRADIAQRLQDQADQFAREREQRFAEYQDRIEEIEAQRKEQLRQAQEAHTAEMKRLQEQKVAKIKELDAQFIEERKRRNQYLIDQIRNLDASLLGETKLRQQYQAKMLTDLDTFLATYRNKLATLGGVTGTTGMAPVGHHSAGGYAGYGNRKLGENGYEFVMSHNTARAAEEMIGGRLTQDGLLAALQGAGRQTQVTWNDRRRFDGDVTMAMRRAIQKDTQAVLKGVFA